MIVVVTRLDTAKREYAAEFLPHRLLLNISVR